MQKQIRSIRIRHCTLQDYLASNSAILNLITDLLLENVWTEDQSAYKLQLLDTLLYAYEELKNTAKGSHTTPDGMPVNACRIALSVLLPLYCEVYNSSLNSGVDDGPGKPDDTFPFKIIEKGIKMLQEKPVVSAPCTRMHPHHACASI